MYTLLLLLALFAPQDQTVVVYTGDNCPPCQRLKADYRADPSLFGGRRVQWVNIDRTPGTGVSAVPTLVIYEDKRPVGKTTGYGGPGSLRAFLQRWQ